MTGENKKIILSISIAFFISFGILASIILYDHSKIMISSYPEPNNAVPTIFLLGSSEIGALDPEFINQFIENSGKKYQVFNLAKTNDSPSQRIKDLDLIISSKPTIVIYSIGYRDLSNYSNQNPFDIKEYFQKPFRNIFGDVGTLFENPKLVTFKILKNFVDLEKKNFNYYSPFYPQDVESMKIIHNQQFIENQYSYFGGSKLIENNVNSFEDNLDAQALDVIISSLRKNNVYVILLVTPHDKTFNELIDEDLLNSFNILVTTISEKHKVKNYSFYNSYFDEDIWTTFNHIAYKNINSIIFSKDVSKIILDELN